MRLELAEDLLQTYHLHVDTWAPPQIQPKPAILVEQVRSEEVRSGDIILGIDGEICFTQMYIWAPLHFSVHGRM